MSSFRGATGGANKPRVHNVNSVYSGKNTAASKASGPSKHGLQSLGKATAVVRRMPPPATLPSLKAEHGQDPTIAIVPQGGTGWMRSSEDPSNKQNGSSAPDNANAPDLRPTWAKPTSGSNSEQNLQGNAQNPANQVQGTAAQVIAGQAPPNNRDFPSLAASVAAAGKDALPLKPQKTNAWGTNLEDAHVEIPAIPLTSHQSSTGGYIGASTAPKTNVDRKLPERYFSSTTSVVMAPRAGKANFREKLARLSIESKEPSVDQEAKQPEKEPTPVPVQQPIQQQPPQAQVNPVNLNQPPPVQNQQRTSQDVRQIQHGLQPLEHQQPQEWQQPTPDGYYEYDRHHVPGRGEGGYDRRYQRQQGFQRYDETMRQSYRQEHGNGDELGWNTEDVRGPQGQGMRQNIQGNRYRMDSRSSNETDSSWQGFNRQNRIPGGGWYDNTGYPMNHEFSANHGYQQNQSYRGQDYRRQGHDCDYGTYNDGQNFHKSENQGYRNPPPGPQRMQQPEMPYRMLKRNDEKSAEYIAHHGGAVIPQNTQEQQDNQKKQKEKQKITRKQEEEQESQAKPSPPENVWEKRMEERKKEEKTAKITNKYQQELDYNFPSIDQNPKEQEWNSELYGNSNQRRSQRKNGPKPKVEVSADVIGSTHWIQQPTGPSWDDLTIPADHRIRELHNDEIDDDVYTGTKREFVNSKRGRNVYKTETSTRGKTRGTPSRGASQSGRKPKNPEGKRRHEDNFSNMGEFHAEDYKISDELVPPRNAKHRDSDSGTHDDNSFDGSRRGSKRGPKSRSWKKNGEEENGNMDHGRNKKHINNGSATRGISSRFASKHPKPMKRDEKKSKSYGERSIEGIKSPAISEGVDDEWETASESSDIAERIRDEKSMKPEKKAINNNKKKMNGTSDDDKIEQKPARTGQKNVKPASHTFQGNSASVKNNGGYNKNSNVSNNSHLLQLNKKDAKVAQSVNARDSRKAPVQKDGLAGVDINDASVIVIDNQPDIGGIEDGISEADFEEVMSKKQRKQKQLQLEEERKKEIREKEKAERQQAKKAKVIQKKPDKKSDRKSQEKSPSTDEISVSIEESMSFQTESSAVEPDLGTSVWNSVRVLPAATTVIEEKQRTHIPSPIARPTKCPQSGQAPVSGSMNIEVNAVKDEFSAFGVTTSTVTTSTKLYDIQPFDPKTSPIGTKPMKNVQKTETEGVMNSDHAVLKEKLDKVKDFWQGDDGQGNAEKSSPNLSQAHGPNVAKVKPQPQLQDQQQQQEKTKPQMDSCIFPIPQAQSPNLYHQNQMFPIGQTSPFGPLQTANYSIIYGTNEFMQYGPQNSPPSHSVFGGQLGLMNQPPATRPQNSYDGAVFGGLWSNGLDFLSNINQNPVQPQQNRYQQQYNSNSRPNSGPSTNSGPIHPTNIPPPSINFNQQGQIGGFVPTHMPPPPISQHYPPIGPFNPAPTPPIGNNRGNGNRFPVQQNSNNFRQQQMPQGPHQQYGFPPPHHPNNRPGSGSNQKNSGIQNAQNQRGSPNWQKNNQQPNYGGYFNVKYGASQSTA